MESAGAAGSAGAWSIVPTRSRSSTAAPQLSIWATWIAYAFLLNRFSSLLNRFSLLCDRGQLVTCRMDENAPLIVINCSGMIIIRRAGAALLFSAVVLISLSCRSARPGPAAATHCDNEGLTAYPALLVIAPHPDDETLGFAGLIDAYLRAGKPVSVVVVTDGDAYCEACRFWKNSSVAGPMCTSEELSDFGDVRRSESAAAAAILGLQPPRFLRYPDTGLAAAWRNL